MTLYFSFRLINDNRKSTVQPQLSDYICLYTLLIEFNINFILNYVIGSSLLISNHAGAINTPDCYQSLYLLSRW